MRATALAFYVLLTCLFVSELCMAQLAITPGINEYGVAVNSGITVTFPLSMDQSTVNDNSFIVTGTFSGRHSGIITPGTDPTRDFSFIPFDNFSAGEIVRVTLTTGIDYQIGDPYEGYMWSFLTAVAQGPGYISQPIQYCAHPIESDDVSEAIPVDLNGDGYLDIIRFTKEPDALILEIFTNDQTGLFESTQLINYSTEYFNRDFTYGNFDGDSFFDLVCVQSSGTTWGQIILYLNDGTGHFVEDYSAELTTYPYLVRAADMNNDRFDDLVMITYDPVDRDNIQVFLNDGTGHFNFHAQYGIGDHLHAGDFVDMIAADFTNDGFLDVAAINRSGQEIWPFVNTGQAYFYPRSEWLMSDLPVQLYPLKINDDNFLDIVTVNRGAVDTYHRLINYGDGYFQGLDVIGGSIDPYSVYATFLNDDNYIDLLIGQSVNPPYNYNLRLLYNNGFGWFEQDFEWHPIGDSSVMNIIAADLDKDNDLDLIPAYYHGFFTAFNGPAPYPSPEGFSPYPDQNELNVSRTAHLGLDLGADFWLDLGNPDDYRVNVYGSISGLCDGDIYITGDHSWDFDPDEAFEYGELVSVSFSYIGQYSWCYEGPQPFLGYTWSFTIEAEDGTALYNPFTQIPIEYSGSPSGTNHICAGDFNNDGLADLAAVCTYANVVAILIQDAANPGTFLAPQFTPVHGGWIPGLCAAELNGDEYTDLVTLEIRNYSPDERSANFLINQGPPNYFTDIQRLVIGSGPSNRIEPGQVEPADFDGDGDLDLVVTDTYSDLIDDMLILYNPGDGISYEIDSLYSADGQNDICIADFDQDGDQDLAAHLFYGNGSVFIYFNEGGRVFDRFEYPAGLAGPRSLCAGDLNRDGLPDIAVVNNPNGGINSIKILLNDEADPGHAFNISTYNLGEHWSQHPYDIWTSDLNENGYLDLAIGFSLASQIAVLLNNADETGPAGTFYTDRYSRFPLPIIFHRRQFCG